MKIPLEDIQAALKEANIEQPKQKQVLDYINKVIQDNHDHNPPVPKLKNEFAVILYDKDNQLVGKEFTASVITAKEGDDLGLVLNKISQSAQEQNEQTKKKNNLIKTIGEACQNLKRKFIKDKGIMIKTKVPVRVLISNNQLV